MTPKFSGRALKAARLAAGLKPEQLAIEIGRSAASVLQYERDDNLPTVGTVCAIAAALNVSVADLFVADEAVTSDAG